MQIVAMLHGRWGLFTFRQSDAVCPNLDYVHCDTEPGIHYRNDDSCGNENRKSQKKTFRGEKNCVSFFFSMKVKIVDL